MTKQDMQNTAKELSENMGKVDMLRGQILATIMEKGFSSDIIPMMKDFAVGVDVVNKQAGELLKEIEKSILLSDDEKRGNLGMIGSAVKDFNDAHRTTQLEFDLYERMIEKLIKVNYHKDIYPDLEELQILEKGDFIDLRAAENVTLKQGEFKLISLGISVELPRGYYAEVVPRSSTYKNFGIIMSNSIGIIDESYCGDNDIWRFPAIAMRDTEIKINDRIAQFRLVRKSKVKVEAVDKLGNEDRGGIGSTGTNEIKDKILNPEREEAKAKFEVIK